MEYDFDIGPEDEVMAREQQRTRERYYSEPGGIGAATDPLVRIILALLTALGVQSVREALRRIKENDDTLAELRRSLGVMRHNYETSPMMKIAGEIAATMGMPNASAADLLARIKALFVPVDVEADIAALVAELRRCGDVSAIVRAIVRPIVEDRARLRREVEDLHGRLACDSALLKARTEIVGKQAAEIARLKSAPGEAQLAQEGAPSGEAGGVTWEQACDIAIALCEDGDIVEQARAVQRIAGKRPSEAPTEQARRAARPKKCDECGAPATKQGTTGTFCNKDADPCSLDITQEPAMTTQPLTPERAREVARGVAPYAMAAHEHIAQALLRAAAGELGSPAPSEDERAQAERWARSVCSDVWNVMGSENQALQVDAILPLVREHRRDLEVMRRSYETSPMTKLAGEIAAAMGMSSAPIGEVVERARRLFAPVDVEGDVTRLVEGITQAAEALGIAVRTWITPLVEDRARLRREIELEREKTRLLRIDKETLRQTFDTACEQIATMRAGRVEADAIEVAAIRAGRDEALADVERLTQEANRLRQKCMPAGDLDSPTPPEDEHAIAERWAQSYESTCVWQMMSDRERATKVDAALPLVREARGWSRPAPLTAAARTAIATANNALANVCHGDHEHQIECHMDTLPAAYRRLAEAAKRALGALSPIVLSIADPDTAGSPPYRYHSGTRRTQPAPSNVDASIENPLAVDVRRSPAPEPGLPSAPARVSLPATRATADGELDTDRDAFFRGVEQGRREALDHPSGLVLVFEDGIPPAEVMRVAELYRSVRGVVAALPVADVALWRDEKSDAIKRLAALSVELISARAANTKLERAVKRLTTLVRALRAQRAEARVGQSALGIKLGDAQGEIAMLAAQRDELVGEATAATNQIADMHREIAKLKAMVPVVEVGRPIGEMAVAGAEEDDGPAQRLRAGLDHLRIAADMGQMQTLGGTAHLAVVAKDASGAGRLTATLEAQPFFADLEALLGGDDAPDSVDPRDLPPDSKCRNRLRKRAAQEIAESWALKVGDRVQTVAPLTCGAYTDDSVRVRRAGAMGVVVRPLVPPAGDAVAWVVRHDDGGEAPYDADELLRAPRDLSPNSNRPVPQAPAERESRLDSEQRVMTATSAGAAAGLRRVMAEMGIEQRAPAERLCVAVLVTDPVGRVAVIESAKKGRAWEIPGGGVEEDETPHAAAIREVAEELGVQLVEDALGPAGIVYGTPKPGAAFASVIHVFRARAEGELRAGSDAKGACWMHARAVLDLHANGRLSDLQITHDVLLPWAREAVGGAS